ncbi:MAG TPA: sensor histidine kinase [Ruminococcaceae bacterium]|jgi:two-component system sensor histidine kinase YesM|nr:sensor histidine kinase [Oscillospiraceae bacterium]
MIKDEIRKIKDRLQHSFRRRSFQFTLSLSFTAAAILGMAAIGLFLSMQYLSGSEKQIAQNNQQIVGQVEINLNSYLRNMMHVSDSIYYSVLKNVDIQKDHFNSQMSLLYETNRDQIVSIGVFSETGHVIDAEPLNELKSTADVTHQEWFQSAENRIENLHFSTPHVENLFRDPDYQYNWVVSLSRDVELTSAGTMVHGVLLVDMNFNGIEQICSKIGIGKSSYLYIIDSNGEIIYHPRQELLYSNLIQENNLKAASYQDGAHMENFQNKKRLITVKTVGYTGWKIIAVTPLKDVTRNSSQYRVFAVLCAALVMILLIFVNLFISSKMATPIKDLENSVKNIENGNLDESKISVSGSYEVQHLGKTIRSMVQEMKKLMRDILYEQESKRKSELDALQSQINPHFLYNTLDAIVWMIENENCKDAVKMVTSLARLFRISLSKGKTIIPVSDELKHVQNYLTIEKMRFKSKFEFQIKAEPETLSCSTIKLIIQPLVENSIQHGLECADDDGKILIHSYLHSGELYIDVMDNGIGIPPEEVDSLLKEDTITVHGKGSGIGLKNVQERIQLYFGKKYGLTILSEPDEGTTVRIHLPAKPYESGFQKTEGV